MNITNEKLTEITIDHLKIVYTMIDLMEGDEFDETSTKGLATTKLFELINILDEDI